MRGGWRKGWENTQVIGFGLLFDGVNFGNKCFKKVDFSNIKINSGNKRLENGDFSKINLNFGNKSFEKIDFSKINHYGHR